MARPLIVAAERKKLLVRLWQGEGVGGVESFLSIGAGQQQQLRGQKPAAARQMLGQPGQRFNASQAGDSTPAAAAAATASGYWFPTRRRRAGDKLWKAGGSATRWRRCSEAMGYFRAFTTPRHAHRDLVSEIS